MVIYFRVIGLLTGCSYQISQFKIKNSIPYLISNLTVLPLIFLVYMCKKNFEFLILINVKYINSFTTTIK